MPYMSSNAVAEMPFISVVLSNFNGGKYLEEAIESAVTQEYPKFEVIVVDDGSTDESRAIIQALHATYPDRLTPIFHDKNRGQAAGFNTGIRAAKGTLIAFLDSDDVYLPGKLAWLAQWYTENPGGALFQHNLYKIIDGAVTTEKFSRLMKIGDLYSEALQTKQIPLFCPTSGLAIPKHILEKIGPIPEAFRLCADGFLTRTSMCFGEVVSTLACYSLYRVHAENSTYENELWDNLAYGNELLKPNLNAFYEARGFPLRFRLNKSYAPPTKEGNQRRTIFRVLENNERYLLLRRKMRRHFFKMRFVLLERPIGVFLRLFLSESSVKRIRGLFLS